MTQFLHNIYEQPATLRATAAHLTATLPNIAAQFSTSSQIIFTGMGSSFSAAYVGASLLTQHGIRALAIETSELMETFFSLIDQDTLLVVISQSGRTSEVINLLDRVKNPILAITNDTDSPLARRSDACLLTQAGEERTVSSKTYTAALAAVSLLCAIWTHESVSAVQAEIERTSAIIEASLPQWDQQIQSLIEACSPWDRLVFIGRGSSYASAMMGALMCQEAAKHPSEALSGGQFRHGYIESLSSRTQYVVCAHPLNRRLIEDLERFGASVLLIGAESDPLASIGLPSVSYGLSPILDIVPMQLLAARLVILLNIEPDIFRYGHKVVTQEA